MNLNDLTYKECDNKDIDDLKCSYGIIKNRKFLNKSFKNKRFENCDLSNTYFEKCNLKGVVFYECNLMNTFFIDSNLTRVKLYNCIFRNGSLKESNAYRVLMPFCVIDNIDLKGVKNLHYSQELIAELLKQHVEDSFERMKAVAILKNIKNWCWNEWIEITNEYDDFIKHWIRNVFSKYPESNLLEAFEKRINVD